MTESYTMISFSFVLVGVITLDRNDREVINLLFVLPGLYLDVLRNCENIAILGRKY